MTTEELPIQSSFSLDPTEYLKRFYPHPSATHKLAQLITHYQLYSHPFLHPIAQKSQPNHSHTAAGEQINTGSHIVGFFVHQLLTKSILQECSSTLDESEADLRDIRCLINELDDSRAAKSSIV